METLALLVNPKDFGIEETKAQELTSNLPQILDERKAFESQYAEIVKMDIEDTKTSKLASSLRKLIKDNRTKGIEVWHKNAKDYFLKGGQFVDAIKRQQIAINERMETALEEIEKYAERKEAERKRKLADERLTELNKFEFQLSVGIDLGSMDESMYQNLLAGCKSTYEAKIEAERIAEEERLEGLRLDKIANERRIEIVPYAQFVTENSDLRTMSDADYQNLLASLKTAKSEYEKEQEAIRLENKRLKDERDKAEAKAKAEREEAERKLQQEKDKAEAERKKAQDEANAKLEQERAEKQKLADELADKERKEQEDKERAEALAELELSKGDADKFNDLIKDLEQLRTKYTFKSKKYKDAYGVCGTLIEKTIARIKI